MSADRTTYPTGDDTYVTAGVIHSGASAGAHRAAAAGRSTPSTACPTRWSPAS